MVNLFDGKSITIVVTILDVKMFIRIIKPIRIKTDRISDGVVSLIENLSREIK